MNGIVTSVKATRNLNYAYHVVQALQVLYTGITI